MEKDISDPAPSRGRGAAKWPAESESSQPEFPLSGGDRFRELQDDLERQRRARLSPEDSFLAEVCRDLPKPEPEPLAPPPPHSRQWVVTVLAGLYAEAERKGLRGFFDSTCWVVRAADERLDKNDIDDVPVHLLHGIFLVVSPRQPLRLLWRHRGRATPLPMSRR